MASPLRLPDNPVELGRNSAIALSSGFAQALKSYKRSDGQHTIRSATKIDHKLDAGRFLHGFLLPHATAFYAGVLGLADDHDRLSAVAGYILTHKLDEITNRDVQRGDRTMRRLTKRDTDLVFQQLEAFGWLTCIPGRRRIRPPEMEGQRRGASGIRAAR